MRFRAFGDASDLRGMPTFFVCICEQRQPL
nr:MAG TPA: hypothetical protein [Caudoviricetes sp.]DAJ10697.1 MAG TPA: hypothetical protein [Caudoviricetes sp.]